MNDFKYDAVNVNAKALEEQNENFKNPKNDYQTFKKLSFDPKNYLDLKLKDFETTKTLKIRFLPISSKDSTIFFDISTHALKVNKEIAKSGFKSYVCLNDEKVGSNEECPICKKSKELFDESSKARKEGNDVLAKSLFKDACSLKKKRTFITRVIDRDHEDEGVKFWRFNENSKGEGIYDKLMTLYLRRKEESIEEDELSYNGTCYVDKNGNVREPYNIFDLYEGKDIIITVTKAQIADGHGGVRDILAYNITDSGNKKPLSKDIDKANTWLNDSKTWKDVYSNKTAEYLELVVNGKIPVYNRDFGKYVAKAENDAEQKKAEDEAATEILKENYVLQNNMNISDVNTKQPTTQNESMVQTDADDSNDIDDLPF